MRSIPFISVTHLTLFFFKYNFLLLYVYYDLFLLIYWLFFYKVRDKIKNVKFSLPENFQNQDYNINVGNELTIVELCNYQYCVS